MKCHSKATECLILTGGLLTIIGILLARPASAGSSATQFSNLSYKGRYACRISSDFGGEQAVILLLPNGKGRFLSGSTKTLVTPDLICSNLPCTCVYSLGTESFYTVSANGTGVAFMDWVPSPDNSAKCFGTFTDRWSFTITEDASIQQVADDNNGDDAEPGTGVCNQSCIGGICIGQ